MTTRLRDVLHTTAAQVPAYQVEQRALATARRTRRRRATAVAAALVLVVLGGLVLPAARTSPVDPAGRDEPGALPDRIGLPPLGSLHATDRPRTGPASVIFTGEAGRLTYDDECSLVTVVDGDTDAYRVFRSGWEMTAGTDVVLSPKGRWIAHDPQRGDPRVDIIDLVTGATRQLRSGVAGTVGTEPAAWSPDGMSLVVRDSVPIHLDRSDHRRLLNLIRLDDGSSVRLAEAPSGTVPGVVVAFAPGGARLAWQTGRVVTVAHIDGSVIASFPLAPGTELAGKGAWTPDGRWLTVARRDDARWTLRRIEPATGADGGALGTAGVDDVVGLQLLGWTATGVPWVVSYLPHPPEAATYTRPFPNDDRPMYGNIGSVEVLSLPPDGQPPTTLLTAPRQVVSIDIADEVIRAGQTRVADPPRGVGGRFWIWTAGIMLAVSAVAAYRRREQLTLWWENRRVRRSAGAR
ncbi:TolB family protein [Verrucosispora sp. WMMD703]|uniref:TolB family protein n=1 Tax=Verrucosispora sp. WMMD703 TaxID=3403463 RepID=UPI003B9252EE